MSCRLLPDKPFRLLEVNARHWTFAAAEEAMNKWLQGARELTKAKPEATIEVEDVPRLALCGSCGCDLYKDEIVYFRRNSIICYECAASAPSDGYFDLLDFDNFSLDKTIPM